MVGSLSLMLLIYVFVNIGMVIGLLLVVGVLLLLISYGGIVMVIFMVGFGIFMVIYIYCWLLIKWVYLCDRPPARAAVYGCP